jgi:hypothetical protein
MTEVLGYIAVAFLGGCFLGSAILALVIHLIASAREEAEIEFGRAEWPPRFR